MAIIIAILLGIVVIGLIGYWLFVSTGKIGGQATLQSCKQEELLFCTQWAQIGFGTLTDSTTPSTIDNGKLLSKCSAILGINGILVPIDVCKKLLGLS